MPKMLASSRLVGKNTSRSHLGPLQANFSMAQNNVKLLFLLLFFLGGPMTALQPVRSNGCNISAAIRMFGQTVIINKPFPITICLKVVFMHVAVSRQGGGVRVRAGRRCGRVGAIWRSGRQGTAPQSKNENSISFLVGLPGSNLPTICKAPPTITIFRGKGETHSPPLGHGF